MYRELASYLAAREAEQEKIPPQRCETLDELAAYIRKARSEQVAVRLLFVCTHNSRRSHLAQLWASAAATHCGVAPVEAFSAGTDVTAFNPRAIAALERAGWHARIVDDGKNPIYEMRLGDDLPYLRCFSKVISDPANPSHDFAAVMVCSEADRHCPTVAGARFRVAIPYEDPKSSDGTADEARTYDERCQQIAREMLYVFSRVRESAN